MPSSTKSDGLTIIKLLTPLNMREMWLLPSRLSYVRGDNFGRTKMLSIFPSKPGASQRSFLEKELTANDQKESTCPGQGGKNIEKIPRFWNPGASITS